MELQHQFTVPASVGTTWDTFMDLAGVATCFPGATVTSAEGDSFQGTCKVKLGPISMLYAGSGRFVERDDETHKAVIEATGKDKHGNGTAGATVTISCQETSAEGTAVEVLTDLKVTGKPAQFGRGVMQEVSDKLLQQFVGCLEQRFAEGPPDSTTTESEPAPEPGPAPNPEPAASEAAVGSEAAPPKDATPSPPAKATPAAKRAPAAKKAAPPPAKAAPPPPRAANVERPAFVKADAGGGDDALDLGATVLPVLLKSYAPQLVAGVVGFVLGVLIARRRRS